MVSDMPHRRVTSQNLNNHEFNSERQFIEYGENLVHIDEDLDGDLAQSNQRNRVSDLQQRVDNFGEDSSSSNEDEEEYGDEEG